MAEMDKLFEHIDDIEIAMLTTRRADGHLCSRAMATQKRAAGADLWFVTLTIRKIEDIAFDPHVNLSYYKDRTREWVSVSGLATVTGDREKIRELWAPDWKAWFPRRTIPDMARPMIPAWSSSALTSTPRCFSKWTSPSRSSSSSS